MRNRMRGILVAVATGALVVTGASAALADEHDPVLPVVECADGVPEVPASTPWAGFSWSEELNQLVALWGTDVAPAPAAANGWVHFFEEGATLESHWDPQANGCEAADPSDPTIVTPAAPWFVSDDPYWVYLPLEYQGYQFLSGGAVVEGAVPIGPSEVVTVAAAPLEGFAFPADAQTEWSFTGVPSVVYPTNVAATFYCDFTYEMTWTEGEGYDTTWTDAARGWDGNTITVWSEIPDDATEWQFGDFLELSVWAPESDHTVFPEFLPEGWRINGGGQGGFSAGYVIPFEGSCTPVATDSDDDESTDDGEGTDNGGGTDNGTDGDEGTDESDESTDESDDNSGTATTPPASPTGDALPDTGASIVYQAIAALFMLGAGAAVMVYRRRNVLA